MTHDITPTEGKFRVVQGAGHRWMPIEGLRDFDRLEDATGEGDRIRTAAQPADFPTAAFDST